MADSAASFSSPASRKRKSAGSSAPVAAAAASSASGGAGAGAATSATAAGNFHGIELDEETCSMTVEQYLQHFLAKMTEKAQELADDAVDAVSDVYKQHREEVRNLQHSQKAEQLAKNKAGKKKVWDVQLRVDKTSDEQTELAGKVFTVSPRQVAGGMAKIGRSTGEDFQDGRGVSLPKDWGVSTWHGKFTSVYGTIYFTDLSKYGTRINGELVKRDAPMALRTGDELELGSTVLTVTLVQAAAAAAAAAAPAAGR